MPAKELALTLPTTQATARVFVVASWRGDVPIMRQTAGLTDRALFGLLDLHTGDVVDVEIRATVRRPEPRQPPTRAGSMTKAILADLAHGAETHCGPGWRAQIARETNTGAASVQSILSDMTACGRLVRTRPGWYRLAGEGGDS